jgi:amidase
MRRPIALVVIALACVVATTRTAPTQGFDTPRSFELMEASIPQLVAALESRQINSKLLVKLYLDRIAAFEGTLNAVITLNPRAIAEAHERDVERARGRIRGPLHGIPIALKDNVHTTDVRTTGGALAFRDLVPPYEATLTQKLRDAGAIIVAKTVLTELANWVAGAPTPMPANYSAVAGFGFNPYDPRPDPRPVSVTPFIPPDGRPVLSTGGSSSGIGTAANFWAGNVGTETSGSILSPANQNMLVGIKPTVGRISRHGVIPITADQDTAGPMTRDVASAAIMLGAMEGVDLNDAATTRCTPVGDYTTHLVEGALAGARIGVPRAFYYDPTPDPRGGTRPPLGGIPADQNALMDRAITILRDAGASVETANIPSVVRMDPANNLLLWGICAGAAETRAINPATGQRNDVNCSIVLKYGAKRDMNAWMDSLMNTSDIDSLAELRAFNTAHAPAAIKYGQSRLDISDDVQLAADLARYLEDRAKDIRLAGTEGIDKAMAGPDGLPRTADDYDALLFPGARSADIAARPGYPTVLVPFGFVANLAPANNPFPPDFVPEPAPLGVAFTGTACSEPRLIELAYAFEQASRKAGFGRVPPASAPPLKRRR